MGRSWAVIWLLWLPGLARGYLNGSDFENAYCWINEASQTLQVFQRCPPEVQLQWTVPPPGTVKEGSSFEATYNLTINLDVLDVRNDEITHLNLHACRKRIGACTPILEETPELISMSEEETVTGFDGNEVIRQKYTLDEGTWTVIAHVKFSAENLEGDLMEYEAAIGWDVFSEPELSYLGTDVEKFVVAVAGISYIFYATMLYFAVSTKNKALQKMRVYSITNVLGAIIFTTTVFFWNLYMQEVSCSSYLWFAILGSSLLYTPLFIMSVKYLFFKRRIAPSKASKIANEALENKVSVAIAAAILSFDIVILVLWMTLSLPEPYSFRINTLEYREYLDGCQSTDVSTVLSIITVVVKSVLVLTGLIFLFLAKTEGFFCYGLQRTRKAVLIIAIAGVVAIVINTAFNNDEELVFLIRSLAIIIAGVGGTWWIFDAYLELKMLDNIKGIGQYGPLSSRELNVSYGSQSLGVDSSVIDDPSSRAFEKLFKSAVVRGYMCNYAVQTQDTANLEFCCEVIQFRASEKPLLESAASIIKNFIRPNSSKAVKIMKHTRQKVFQDYADIRERIGYLQQRSRGGTFNLSFIKSENSDVKIEEKKTSPRTRAMPRSPEFFAQHKVQKSLRSLFDEAYREARRWVYLHHWSTFRTSEFGLAAASWLKWMEFLSNFTYEEQSWAAQDINARVQNNFIAGTTEKVPADNLHKHRNYFVSKDFDAV
uniref:G-protein coupled receptors family 3 profile domain-containing protein n=1 Tax=Lotharella globosa TaxID=91324 RepID=A0A7S3YVZ4_9EUKA